jgi:hypothetical protein
MKTENPNIKIIQNVIDETSRFVARARAAQLRLMDNDEATYTQYSFKEIAALKRSALDLKMELTSIIKMKS